MKPYILRICFLISCIIFFGNTTKLFAQAAITNYSLSHTSGTFTALSGATTATPRLGSNDDGAYNNIPIGFDFWYMGAKYTTISAGTNGFLVLGATVLTDDNYKTTNDLDNSTQRNVLAPLWDDIALDGNGSITYQTAGTAGSRTFTVQYLNVLWNYSATDERIQFQVKLYEATGAIEFKYKQVTGTLKSPAASIGISAGTGKFLSLNGSGTSPTASSATETSSIATRPATGQIYTFTPSSQAPTNLTFTNVTTTAMKLNWTDNSTGETAFYIYRSTDGVNYTLFDQTAGNVTSYDASGLAVGTNYYWRIDALRETMSTPLAGSQATVGVVPNDAAVAYPFSGNADDVSGNNNDGALQGSPTSVADRDGVPNSAYSFNGTSQYVSTTTLIAAPGPNVFSLSIWFKTNTTTGGKLIGFGGSKTGVSSNYDRHIFMSNTGKLYFGVYNGSIKLVQSAASYNDNVWHNAVAVLSLNGMKLYVDGTLVDSDPTTTIGENYAGYWRVGFDNLDGWEATTDRYFDGSLDDIQIFNREITPSEVATSTTAAFDGYAYRKTITLNSSVVMSGTQTNFPYLIKITDPDLKLNTTGCDLSGGSMTYGKVLSATGADITFKTTLGAPLTYEIESYDPATGTVLAWIKFPSIGASNMSINMLFGKASPVVNDGSDVWTDYKVVYHFNEDTYTGTTKDATSLGLVGTNTAMSLSNLVTGQIGNAYTFNGSNQKIVIPSNSAYDIQSSPFTISAWINSTNAGVDQKVISNQNASSVGYKMGIYNSKPESQIDGNPNRDGQTNVTGTSLTIASNAWHYLQSVYNGTTLTMYVDGVARQTRTSVAAPSAGMNLNIGVGEGGNGYWFNGIIDEARISRMNRSAAWTLSEYHNQLNPTNTGTNPSIASIGSLQADAVAASTYNGLIFTFTGATNNSFSTASNFTSNASNLTGLPDVTNKVSVIIQAGKTPSLSADLSIYGLYLGAGSTLTLNSKNLTVGCNIYNNGTITGSAETLTFNGTTAAQEYYGSATNSSIGNLTVSNTAGGTININSGKLDVYKIITLAANTKLNVVNGATFTMKSNASAFSNLAPLTGTSAVTGNLNIETYFTGGAGKRGTRMVSPAVDDNQLPAGSKVLQQLKNDMVITGPGGVTNGFDQGNTPQPFAITLTKYNEPATAAVSQFTSVSNIKDGTVPLVVPGEGYFLFFRGNRTGYTVPYSSAPVLTNGYVPESFAATLTGPINQGEISVPITRTNNGESYDGYNVVGNPYPATIDWEQVYAANSSVVGTEIRIVQPGGAMMTRTGTGGSAVVTNAIGVAANTKYIQPGQGFYIRKSAVGNSSLVFTESDKAINSTPNRLLTTPGKPQLLMAADPVPAADPADNNHKVFYLNLQDGVNTDETAIVFEHGNSANYDEKDAVYISGSTVLLSTLSADGKSNAVNFMPDLSDVQQVKLSINAAATGPLTLHFTSIDAIGRYKVKLKDNYLNTLTDIKANPVYAFNIDRTIAATFGTERFVLLFEAPEPLTINLSAFTVAQQNTTMAVNWTTATEESSARFEVERAADGVTFSKVGEVAGAGNSGTPKPYTFNDPNPLTGINYYRLKQVYTDDSFSYSEIKSATYTKLTNATISAFAATQQNATVALNWSTTVENGTSHFEAEHSTDGISFSKTGDDVAAAGNSTTQKNYTFSDDQPVSGLNYYRLKIAYTDGTSDYSAVTSLTFTRPSGVTLSSFSVRKDNDNSGIVVNWATTSETNSSKFEIERSIDGTSFTKIGEQAAAGNSVSLTKYTFQDASPVYGTDYYRLKIILTDGTFVYSAVESQIYNSPFYRNTISEFTVKKELQIVSVKWTTTSEENSTVFEIERSVDGQAYIKLGEVAAAGNSTSAKPYAFSDASPVTGKLTYRIKSIFSDGSFTYSELRSISYVVADPNKLMVYPNPVIDFLNIDVYNITAQLTIYDLLGKPVKKVSFTLNEPIRVNISELRSGVYIGEVKDLITNTVVDKVKFIKK